MKIKLLTIISACLLLTACGGGYDEAEHAKEESENGRYASSAVTYNTFYTITDKDTGCEYILASGSSKSALIPRLDSDGVSIRGCKNQ